MFEEFQQAYEKEEQRRKIRNIVQVGTIILLSIIILLISNV